jgi:hypothetical protein
MARTINGTACPLASQGARRARQHARRPHRVEFSLTAGEFAELDAAASRAGLARGAYAAEAALAAARSTATVGGGPLRVALGELIEASGQVRKIGVNLNQAVAKLNAGGQRSGDLLPYAAECLRRVRRVDDAAAAVRRALRG